MKNKIIIGLVLSLLVYIVCSVYTCNRYKNNSEVYRLQLRDTLGDFVKKRSELMDSIYEQAQIITDYEKAIKANLISKKEREFLKEQNYKKDIMILRLEEQIEFNNVSSNYDTKPMIIFKNTPVDTTKYMKIPQEFSTQQSKYYYLHGSITEKGVFHDIVRINSYPNIYIGSQKKWFLGTKKPMITYTNENPYVNIKNMNNIVTIEPKKLYEKWLFQFFVGGGVGYFCSKIINK